MLKLWATSIPRLLVAALIGLLAWFGVYRLTMPLPHHACIAGLLEFPQYCTFFNFPEPRLYRFDSTGWWFAVGPSRFVNTLSDMA